MTVVKAAAWEADISWPVRGVQKGNSRLVTEAARMPAHTLAVGAQPACLTETADGGVDTRDCREETEAVDVGDDAVADIFLILPVAPITIGDNFVASFPTPYNGRNSNWNLFHNSSTFFRQLARVGSGGRHERLSRRRLTKKRPP